MLIQVRLDLNANHAAAAKDLGIPIVISTDAHSTGGMDVMKYGIFQARSSGINGLRCREYPNLVAIQKAVEISSSGDHTRFEALHTICKSARPSQQ